MSRHDADDNGPSSVLVRVVQQLSLDDSPERRMSRMREQVLSTSFAPSHGDLAPVHRSEAHQRVLVLPEMWPVGFFNVDGYVPFADRLFGTYVDLLTQISRELGCWTFGGSAPCRESGRYVNRSLVISPVGVRHHFDKLHLFSYRSREAEVLSPGDELVIFHSPLGMTGILTCFDLRFPEAFRALRVRGCEAFVIAAAWLTPRIAHWTALLMARAIENQAWVIGVNGSGTDFGVELGGRSMIIDPRGSVLLDLGPGAASTHALIEPWLVQCTRSEFPFHGSVIPDLLETASTFPVSSGTESDVTSP